MQAHSEAAMAGRKRWWGNARPHTRQRKETGPRQPDAPREKDCGPHAAGERKLKGGIHQSIGAKGNQSVTTPPPSPLLSSYSISGAILIIASSR